MRLDRGNSGQPLMASKHLAWSEVVVRGRVELPTFRFSGGFACPHGSATGRLTGPSGALAPLAVHDQPHVSTAVVSKALARAVRVSLLYPEDSGASAAGSFQSSGGMILASMPACSLSR